MKVLFKNYIDTFGGLSKEVWWLALITLINRAGTMVIPFLSLYLNTSLNFSFSQVGWIMSAFGLGSVAGSLLGGKLTDQIGYYKVMVFSLFTTGVLFIGLQFMKTFEEFCVGIFIVMLVADMFRPAMFVALNTYSKIENKTRSVTLIRLAINLGFSAGPAVGGLIITTISYVGLFWIDGITCMLATVLLIFTLNPKKARISDSEVSESPVSAYKDKSFFLFIIAITLFAIVFIQYFSTMPLFYKEKAGLTEFDIGLLLGLNGFLIFLFEMPLIKWLENSKYSFSILMLFGTVITGLSFVILLYSYWIGFILIGILLMTLGEMIAFPFSNAYAMRRSKRGKAGQYMALYAVSFSVAHLVGHNLGFQMVNAFGFNTTWLFMSALAGLSAVLLFILKKTGN